MEKPELYFPRDLDWRDWLHENHSQFPQGVYLIFYKIELNIPSMRWEEAVRVALCYGWIDSTVKSIGNGKRQQYFCPRNPKSNWSALNKRYITQLEEEGLIHDSGWKMIELAKSTGTWNAMDDVENLIIPNDLKIAFKKNGLAYKNFKGFSPGYQKGYLSWLFQAKREETRLNRISHIIELCERNIKTRQ